MHRRVGQIEVEVSGCVVAHQPPVSNRRDIRARVLDRRHSTAVTRQQSPGGESRCRVLRWRGGSRALARIESVRRRDLDRPRRSELRVDERNVWWLDRRGGWTAAVALRAVCDEVDGEAAPSAITVNFVGRVEPGSDLLIQTRRVGGGRSVSYWQSEVTPDDVTLAIA